MICEQCGIDHHAVEVVAELPEPIDQGEQLEAEAERAEMHEDAATERETDANDTREAIAETEAAAAVAIAEAQAEAAVDIAEAQAAADVAAAEAIAEALSEPEPLEPAEGDGAEGDAGDGEPAEAEGGATPVSVPPQLEEPDPERREGGKGSVTLPRHRAMRRFGR